MQILIIGPTTCYHVTIDEWRTDKGDSMFHDSIQFQYYIIVQRSHVSRTR